MMTRTIPCLTFFLATMSWALNTSFAADPPAIDVPSAAKLLAQAKFDVPASAKTLWAKDDGLPNAEDAAFGKRAADFLPSHPLPAIGDMEKAWDVNPTASRQLKCLAYLARGGKEARQGVAELCVVQAIRLQWVFPVRHGRSDGRNIEFCSGCGVLALTGSLLYREAERDSALQQVGLQWMRTGAGHFSDVAQSKEGPCQAATALIAAAKLPSDLKDLHGTDEGFFAQLDLMRPEMADVGARVNAKDWEGAKKAYVAVLAQRFSPDRKWPEASMEEGFDTEADDICRNVFVLQAHMCRRVDFGPEVDWTKIIDGDGESRVWMNAHPWTSALVGAYKATGDNKYVTHLCRLFNSWYTTSPPTFQRSNAQWRTLESGGRVGYRWPNIFFALANQPKFQQECAFNMARSMLDHGKYLAMYSSGGGNWLQVEASGLATVGLLFPEFKLSPMFYDVAVNRLVYVNGSSFLPDGFQSECTVFYHYFPIRHIVRVAGLAAFLNRPFPESAKKHVERGLEVIEYMAYPDGTLPMFSDANALRLRPIGPFQIGAKVFNREDFRWMATEGREGRPPRETSYDLPSSGFCAMRDKWGPDGQLLAFDAGFFGAGHQHEDKLSFVFFAGGRELIGDVGIYSYKSDTYEPYWRGSWGHNTIVIDGLSQHRALGPKEPLPDPDRRFVRGDGFDFAIAAYRGAYSPRGTSGPRKKDGDQALRNVQHQRCIFYVKGQYAVVGDRVLGDGEHEMEVIFHPTPIVAGQSPNCTVKAVNLETRKDGTVVTKEPDAANVAIVPASMNGVTLRDIIGQKDPPRGWVALYGIAPSHDIVYRAKARLPWKFETVVAPLPAGSAEPKKAASEVVKAADGKPCTAVRYGDDLLLVSYQGPATMTCGDVTFHGTALLLSCEGDRRKAFMVDGGLLQIGGKRLYASAASPARTILVDRPTE